MTFRISSLLALTCVLLSPVFARAQMAAPGAGGTTHLPLAVDLMKVPIGSWAEYRSGDGKNIVTVRMVLVARAGKSADIETHVVGGPLAGLGSVTIRMSIPVNTEAEVRPTQQVIQIGDNDPMILPGVAQGGPGQALKRLNPRDRIGVEAVTVPAGAFPKAEHYHDKGQNGEVVDYWISKDALPLGLVKVAAVGTPQSPNQITMELIGHGGGAKPTIKKTPKPFDAAAMMKEVQPGAAAAGGPMLAPPPGAPPAKK